MEKHQIETALKNFGASGQSDASINLFNILGYNTSRNSPLQTPDYRSFFETFSLGDLSFRSERARTDEWNYVDFLFQLTKHEVSDSLSLFDTSKVDETVMESYLFITVGLTGNKYSRTILSEITREINRIFTMPVLVLFKYDNLLTLSIINRRINKKNSDKDVLDKVTLIKDIDITSPHRAHIEILYDLSFQELQRKYQINSFIKLHEAWQKTLDIKTLSKKFFDELADWFFWAHDKVRFPNDRNLPQQNNTQMGLIRLVTRMIFVWFLKEKKLVPENLFDPAFIKDLLKGFDPDSSESPVYYNAILQNLFFATLNQKMNERKFAIEGDFEVNRREYGIKTLFRHANLFTKDRDYVLSLFQDIPFLNGGLFDCLDKPADDSGKILYTDGFTRKQEKSAVVPDLLFWGKEDNADLSKFYESERKNRKCRGLIQIFSGYKFTIEENTPIEEEIALDPELLGKVFENLLAFYNPETSTTARKSTGSFYTPREIVNYMVDESLIAYLKTKLLDDKSGSTPARWPEKEEELENHLRLLVSYSDAEHPFTKDEIVFIIECIDSIKVLDPACGSGAFPMGILHKLVFILGKLDPDNSMWRNLQKQKALKETDTAFDLTEQAERERRLQEINEAFENNSSDYGRKLYLIENCIYGVDIQPIAVQISKLRFFISLLVDQIENSNHENRGIRALPNLETKFVAANTLIGLNATDSPVIVPNEVVDLEDELKELRNKHFLAKTYKEKIQLQKEDKATRQLIASKLEAVGFPPESAKKISNYDIYDQMASSDWFDPEWMFGVSTGFDVVIGNPPWIYSKNISAEAKSLYSRIFKTAHGQYDLFNLFIEVAVQFSVENGIISFITPDRFITNIDYEALRIYLLKYTFLIEISNLGDGVFENVDMPSAIFIAKKSMNFNSRLRARCDFFSAYNFKDQNLFLSTYNSIFTIFGDDKVSRLLEMIQVDSGKISDHFLNARGVEIGKTHGCIIETATENSRSFLRGMDIDRYEIHPSVYIEIDHPDINYKEDDLYVGRKILLRKTGEGIKAAIDVDDRMVIQVIYILKRRESSPFEEFYTLGILNSNLMEFYYHNTFGEKDRKTFPHLTQGKVLELPLKLPDDLSMKKIALLAQMASCINNNMDSKSLFLQTIINYAVYAVYLPSKFIGVLPELLGSVELPSKDFLSLDRDSKNAIISNLIMKYSDQNSPQIKLINDLIQIEEVKIIEGRE